MSASVLYVVVPVAVVMSKEESSMVPLAGEHWSEAVGVMVLMTISSGLSMMMASASVKQVLEGSVLSVTLTQKVCPAVLAGRLSRLLPVNPPLSEMVTVAPLTVAPLVMAVEAPVSPMSAVVETYQANV